MMTNTTSTTSTGHPVPGAHSQREIESQPESWQGAIDAINASWANLQALFAENRDRPVVFVGCGSPYYLELSAAAAYRALTNKWAIATPASEVLFNLDTALPGKSAPLVIAVSRSGETSELLLACKQLKERRGSPILVITVSRGTSLEKLADVTVSIPNAGEQSMAQTRSFSAMLLSTLGAVAAAAHSQQLFDELRRAPDLAQSYLNNIRQPIADLMARGFNRIFFLGSGLRYGLANEGSLKMKEMSLTNAEPFHFMEFRHGPQSMVDEHTLVVGLVSRHAAEAETTVLREMVGLGGTVVAIGPDLSGMQDTASLKIQIDAGLSETAELVFYMPPLHLLAYNQAMGKGLDCDSPRNLHAWIRLPDLESKVSGSGT
ncbi:MAG: SIS domain-containing protein [Chloroflexi bacterium]|nr:SIS domain-containing protein [Chloroflexota bacterium]